MKTAILAFIALAAPAVHADFDSSDLAYYQQFPYTYTENADGAKTYRFMMSTGPVMGIDVGPSARGEVFAIINVALEKDGTFTMMVDEHTQQGFPVAFGLKFTGAWSVPGQKLLVGDIAEGTRAVFDGRNAFQLTFLKDLNTPGLQGKTVIFDYGYSNAPIDPFHP